MSQINNLEKESVFSLNLFDLQSNSPKKNRSLFKTIMNGFFNSKKTSFNLLKKSRGLLNRSHLIHKKIYDGASQVQGSIVSLNETTDQYTKEIQSLSSYLKKEKEILSNRSKQLDLDKENLEEKTTRIRKEEIILSSRKSENSKQFKEIKRVEKEIQAKEVWMSSESERLQNLEHELNSRKDELEYRETSLDRKEQVIQEEKESIDEILLNLEEKKALLEEEYSLFQKEKEDWKSKLEERIIEYEKKLAEIENIKSTVDLFKKDKSKEGKQEKLVVQEAVRQMQKMVKDFYEKSLELEEKYCKGTFKGFALPLDQIVEKIETLKEHFQEISEYASENPHIPLEYFITEIKTRLKKAEESKELWDFPNAFISAVEGITFCLSFEAFLKSLNDWSSESTESEEKSSEEENQNYYEELGLNFDATQEEIKITYRKLVQRYHPDKINPDLPDEEKEAYKKIFLRIQKAYEILSDEDSRKDYDSKRTRGESK